MTILDSIKKWETSPLSTVCNDLLELGYCCTIEFRPHSCETGKWISISVEKEGQKWGGIGGSRTDIARDRLVAWADKNGLREENKSCTHYIELHRRLLSFIEMNYSGTELGRIKKAIISGEVISIERTRNEITVHYYNGGTDFLKVDGFPPVP